MSVRAYYIVVNKRAINQHKVPWETFKEEQR
jgi:hypothetical protein